MQRQKERRQAKRKRRLGKATTDRIEELLRRTPRTHPGGAASQRPVEEEGLILDPYEVSH